MSVVMRLKVLSLYWKEKTHFETRLSQRGTIACITANENMLHDLLCAYDLIIVTLVSPIKDLQSPLQCFYSAMSVLRSLSQLLVPCALLTVIYTLCSARTGDLT